MPSGQREPRHVWRIALLAFSVTAALTAGAIGFVLYVLPQLNVKTTLEVISVPEGAFVELDGKKLPGRTRMVIPIDDPSRPYRVTVSLPDHASWTSTVRFEGGEERKQLIASLIPKFGRLLVESVPSGAEVLLNGRSIGKTPVQQEKLSLSESPKLELRLPGHAPERRKLKWGKQTWQRVKVVMRKKRRRRQ